MSKVITFSHRVSPSALENKESAFFLAFENVPCDKTGQIWPRLAAILEDTIATWHQNWDETSFLLHQLIDSKMAQQAANLEKSPHEAIASMIIGISISIYFCTAV